MIGSRPHTRDSQQMAEIVERNIRALCERRARDEREKAWHERLADGITRFAGSMYSVFVHVFVYGSWIVANLGWLPVPQWDPTFVVLAMVASVEAIFLSTFILISQNRMAALADKRADLDLQISLLAEHEVTRLIQLVTQIAQKMGVEQSRDPELSELSQDVKPEKVLDKMYETERKLHR